MTSSSSDQRGAYSIWGGRFGTGSNFDDAMQEINSSVDVDKRLAAHDIAGSMAHVRMLAACGIITDSDRDIICSGLCTIGEEIASADFVWSNRLEDVHMNIEARLQELIGDAAGRMHTARSRNDQVATDLRLWVRDGCARMMAALSALIEALLTQAEREAETIMPGYTHLQNAQAVTFGHHLLAYIEMLRRDRGRFDDAMTRLNECPLGSGALAGTGFPIDRDMTAKMLGFAGPMSNSLDAVAARDFAVEAIAAASICAAGLSRLAEEIVIWVSAPFGFVKLDDAWSTGSSMMPQKRNPDAAELIRAKTGRINGSLLGLLTILKGLPLAYGKDLQEDKAFVFEAFDALELSLTAMTGMIETMVPDRQAMRKAAEHGHVTATDLADWLVRELDIPFRRSHHIAGAAVREAEARSCRLDQLPLEALTAIEPKIHAGVSAVLSVEASVQNRASFGGTAPSRVREQIANWRARLASKPE